MEEAARRIGEFSSAPVIFTTGYLRPDIKEMAMALKPAAFLIKPVDISLISSSLEPVFSTE
ncbi:MAG: hypothetical protein ACOYM2_11360 [Rectinemataceae bacterium]